MRIAPAFAVLGCAVVATATLAAPTARGSGAAAPTVAEPELTFVSMPDTFNTDFADVSDAAGWAPGSPNSINPAYQRAIDLVFDEVTALAPDALLVAGDTVEGHWGRDTARTGIFGPIDTDAQRRRAVVRAAEQYYGAYVERWRTREVPLYAAIGDHEVGDDPWRVGLSPYATFKHENVGLFKGQWAHHFTDDGERFARRPRGSAFERTAYAVMLSPEVLLVSLDVFRRTPRDVVADIGRQQLDWLTGQLRGARRRGVDWVVVQGHTPILGPVRHHLSSRLMYRDGARSPLWRALREYDVDLYLAGEVHANTVTLPRRGPVQVAHGGLFREARATALVGRVRGRRLGLELLRWEGSKTEQPEGQEVWQTDTIRTIDWDVVYQSGPRSLGRMTLGRHGRVLASTGLFDAPFRG